MGKLLLYASIAVTLATTILGFINNGKLTTLKGELKTSKLAAKHIAATNSHAEAQAESMKIDLAKNRSQMTETFSELKDRTAEATKLASDLEEEKIKNENLGADKPCARCAEYQDIVQEKEQLIGKLKGDLLSRSLDPTLNSRQAPSHRGIHSLKSIQSQHTTSTEEPTSNNRSVPVYRAEFCIQSWGLGSTAPPRSAPQQNGGQIRPEKAQCV